jgi:hypothetical protein
VLGQGMNLNDKISHPAETVASAAGDAVEQAVESEANKIIEALKAKFWAEVALLEAKAKPYLYLAAGTFFAILMIPALTSSLLTVLIVRWMDRRRAHAQEQRALKGADVEAHARPA